MTVPDLCDVYCEGIGVSESGNEVQVFMTRRKNDEGNWTETFDLLVYRRRRPEWWWGVAWLPEFWLTLVLGVGLLWSLWRDQRRFRASGAEVT